MSKRVCVLIATHERIEITTITLQALQQQSILPKVVLVVSKQDEFDYYTRKFPLINVIVSPNKPLGSKWQAGVDFARKLDISALVIQGSDDILCKSFIKGVENTKDLVDFHGLKEWWIYDPATKELHLFEYTPKDFPLGGGRYYTKELLDKINWKIFDTTRNSCLDDLGWHSAKGLGQWSISNECHKTDLQILAIKGNWPVMNPLEQTKKHPNAKLIRTITGSQAQQILKEIYNYDPERVL